MLLDLGSESVLANWPICIVCSREGNIMQSLVNLADFLLIVKVR